MNVNESEKISVIVPVRDREVMLKECVASIAAQTWSGSVEIVVVDDGSQVPVAADSLTPLLGSTQHVRIVRLEKSLGAAAARNAGLKAATGSFVAFLDSDDRWLPRKLELQMKVFQDSNADVVACGWRWMSFDTGVVRVERCPDATGLYAGLPRWVHNVIPDVLVRRSGCAGLIEFDAETKSYEPMEYVFRLFRNGCRFGFVSEVLCEFRDHSGSRNSSQSAYRAKRLERMLREYEDVLSLSRVGAVHLWRMAAISLLVAGEDELASGAYRKAQSIGPAVVFALRFVFRFFFRKARSHE